MLKAVIAMLAILGMFIAMPINNSYADHLNGVVAEPGAISPGDTTDIEVHTDEGVFLIAINTWTVAEPDGDICKYEDLPVFVNQDEAEIEATYPDDFEIDVAGGNGVCDTNTIGQYITEVGVLTKAGPGIFSDDWEVSFFVVPETVLGAIAVVGSSIAVLGAFMAFKNRKH